MEVFQAACHDMSLDAMHIILALVDPSPVRRFDPVVTQEDPIWRCGVDHVTDVRAGSD